MGIEPTGPAVHEAQPALKAGRHTSTDPLPLVRVSLAVAGRFAHETLEPLEVGVRSGRAGCRRERRDLLGPRRRVGSGLDLEPDRAGTSVGIRRSVMDTGMKWT